MLRLLLFGAPRVEHNGQALSLRRNKALALLAYLAIARQPQKRDALLALLWPEFDAASARNNLRRELSLLKTVLGEDVLVADRLQIAWNPQADVWLDVAAFEAQIARVNQHSHASGELCAECAGALTSAAQLYTDDLLAGFSLPDSPAFDEWQILLREGLRQQLAQALQALSGWYSRSGAYGAALDSTRRWLGLDPLHEVPQRELMRLYAWAGQQAAALRQHEECAQLLEAELGAAPEPETTELHAAIEARRLVSPATTTEPAPVGATTVTSPASEPPSPARQQQPALHSLPPLAGFVGRQRELADLLRRLTDPDCRLLTLLGPGGIGKTRLALRAAQILAEEWTGDDGLADGVLFVPLGAVETSSGLVSALAAAACFDFYPNVPPDQQLLDYFRAKRMLVILDNFEQLLDASQFVGELLAAAPGLRLLITSRVALNRDDEWFHPVGGLSFPAADDDVSGVAQLARYDAVRLFEQHARRARSDFSLSRARTPIVRLCRLVEGMPLAIELAASWLKVLSVEQVVAALERGLDILSARDKNIPARHRSMRAVLEESWRLLSVEERQTFAQLTVFAGRFNGQAAEAVADASLEVLATLVDKSLLRSGADGRLQMHELLRQFGAEQLAADRPLAHTTHARHSAYYLDFLAECETRLCGPEQQAAADEIGREADNVWAAWRWAIAHEQLESVDRALSGAYFYYFTRGSFQEGAEILSAAVAEPNVARSPDTSLRERVRARARIRRSVFRTYLNHDDLALHDVESALATVQALGLQRDVATAYHVLGLISLHRANFERAREQLNAALAIGRAIDDKHIVADALQQLVRICSIQGDYAEGKRLAQECLDVACAAERVYWMAQALLRLSDVSSACGEYGEAERYCRESLTLFERVSNRNGVANALGHLGWINWCLGGARLEEARTYHQQSLAIFRALGIRGQIAGKLGDLALVAIEEGEYAQAQAYSQDGLALARSLDSVVFVSYHCSLLGRVASARQEFAASRRYHREALRAAVATRRPPVLGFTLYYVAEALAREAAIGPAQSTNAAQLARALGLLGLIAHQPSTRHWDQVRARRLIDELQRALPDLAEAAIARSEQLDWQASVIGLIDELALEPGAGAPASSAGTQHHGADQASLIEPLSRRELEVLRLLAQGLSNPQIAEALIVSVGTVKTHTHNIFAKLGAANRTQAVRRAQALHLV
jgi:predicted ATPase/DNA-binding SARP family transcriptional activator/DNA-binding CsgD family transcriptional regulator